MSVLKSMRGESTMQFVETARQLELHMFSVGELRTEAGRVYKCRQAHTSTTTWQPSATPTLWEPVDPTHAGTLTDPIPWTSGMTAYLNKHYSEGGKTYRCKRDDTGNGTALYYTIAQLPGDYFEVTA